MKKYRNSREKDNQVKKNIKMEITELRKKKTFNQQANFSGNTCYITRIPKNRHYGNFGRYHGK